MDRAKAAEPLPRFRNTVYDVETKKATSLDVADDPQQVVGWGPDDKSFLTVKYSPGTRIGAVVNFRHRWHLFHPDMKTAKPLCDTHELLNLVPSSDGRSLFGSGQATNGEKESRWGMCRIDVGTGQVVEVAHHENQGLAASSWSPNGKRVA